MSTAFEIIVAARELALVGSGGFDSDEDFAFWEGELSRLGTSAADKALARCHVERRLREDAASLKDLEAAVADRRKRVEAQADRVEAGTLDLVREVAAATGGPKLTLADGSWVKVAVRTSHAVIIDDESALPSGLVVVKTQPDKAAIKSAIDAGMPVPGAHVEERTNVSLKWGK